MLHPVPFSAFPRMRHLYVNNSSSTSNTGSYNLTVAVNPAMNAKQLLLWVTGVSDINSTVITNVTGGTITKIWSSPPGRTPCGWYLVNAGTVSANRITVAFSTTVLNALVHYYALRDRPAKLIQHQWSEIGTGNLVTGRPLNIDKNGPALTFTGLCAYRVSRTPSTALTGIEDGVIWDMNGTGNLEFNLSRVLVRRYDGFGSRSPNPITLRIYDESTLQGVDIPTNGFAFSSIKVFPYTP